MVILTKTPLRITLFGGGSDYPSYFNENKGFCINAALKQYSYCTLRRLAGIDPYSYRVCYKKTELVNRIEDIEQPVVRAALDVEQFHNDRLEIHYFSDLPSSSGLGTSSSFACGLLGGLRVLKGKKFGNVELAKSAWQLEAKTMGEIVGVQDQYATALGGFLALNMSKEGIFVVKIPFDDFLLSLQESLLLVFTGHARYSQDVLKSQISTLNNQAEEDYVGKVVDLAKDAWALIEKRRGVQDIGAMLSEAWLLKKKFGKDVSNEDVDQFYENLMKMGCYGAKLIGAGGGGFFLVSASQSVKQKIRKFYGVEKVVDVELSQEGFEYSRL